MNNNAIYSRTGSSSSTHTPVALTGYQHLITIPTWARPGPATHPSSRFSRPKPTAPPPFALLNLSLLQDLAALLASQRRLTHLTLHEVHELEELETLDPTSLWDVLAAALPVLSARLQVGGGCMCVCWVSGLL